MKILQISTSRFSSPTTVDKEPIYSAIHLGYSTFKIKVQYFIATFVKKAPLKSCIVEF